MRKDVRWDARSEGLGAYLIGFSCGFSVGRVGTHNARIIFSEMRLNFIKAQCSSAASVLDMPAIATLADVAPVSGETKPDGKLTIPW